MYTTFHSIIVLFVSQIIFKFALPYSSTIRQTYYYESVFAFVLLENVEVFRTEGHNEEQSSLV